jgi:hypothetical protein
MLDADTGPFRRAIANRPGLHSSVLRSEGAEVADEKSPWDRWALSLRPAPRFGAPRDLRFTPVVEQGPPGLTYLLRTIARNRDMANLRALREVEERVVANGRVEGHEIRLLHQLLYADGKIDREEADFLVVVHKRVQHRTHGFEEFFYNTIKDHILADGRVDAEETAWLRQMIFHDDKLEDEERKFLHQLKGEAKEVSPEFEAFLLESMKYPPERRTAGP